MPVVKSLEVQYLAIEVGKTVDYDGFNYDTLSSVSLETISWYLGNKSNMSLFCRVIRHPLQMLGVLKFVKWGITDQFRFSIK